MKSATYAKTMLFLGLAGLLFSGYLSAVKLFSSTCAFNEPCPYLWGWPACWYGFGMFLIIFIAALWGLLRENARRKLTKVIALVSAAGIVFAGYFTLPEMNNLFSGAATGYTLLLPTCAYGLIFYVLIFVLSFRYVRNRPN